MYGIDREREVARLSRRQMLRRGSMGALGLGLAVGQTRLAEACWGHGGGLLSRLHHRRNQCYAHVAVQPVCLAPQVYAANPICPRNWVGTGFTGGTQVFYYYALEVNASCNPIATSATYGMTFPRQIQLPCCPNPWCSNCIPASHRNGYDPYPASAALAGPGQNDLDCGNQGKRCQHFHMKDDTRDLEQDGLGPLGSGPVKFTSQMGGPPPVPKIFSIPGKGNTSITVACTQFTFDAEGQTRTIAVGLEIPTIPGAQQPADLTKCGPLKGHKNYHYLIEDNNLFYHVVTSKQVK